MKDDERATFSVKIKKISHNLLSKAYGIKCSCTRRNVDARYCSRLTRTALTLAVVAHEGITPLDVMTSTRSIQVTKHIRLKFSRVLCVRVKSVTRDRIFCCVLSCSNFMLVIN
jgi:hypothetical protein